MIGKRSGLSLWVTGNEKGNRYYGQYLKTLQEYADLYNDLAKKNNPHTAIAQLSQNKIELDRVIQELIDGICDMVEPVFDKMDVSENEDWDLVKVSKVIKISLNHTFSSNPYKGFDILEHGFDLKRVDNSNEIFLKSWEVEKEELISDLRHFWELSNETGSNWTLDMIKQAYFGKEKLDNLLLHQRSIDIIISKVLFENYPTEINLEISVTENPKKKNTKGRTPEGNEKELKIFVESLIRKGLKKVDGYSRFWHHDGKYSGKPNKEQITKKLMNTDLLENLGKRQVKRRVTKIVDGMTF